MYLLMLLSCLFFWFVLVVVLVSLFVVVFLFVLGAHFVLVLVHPPF